jgi:hypothetical protein
MRGDPGAARFTRNLRDEPYIFVRGDDDRLYAFYFDTGRGSWRRSDLGLPPGTRVGSSPGAVAFLQDDLRSRYVAHGLVRGADGRLFESAWDGSRWTWTDYGRPNNGTITLTPTVDAYRRGAATFDEVYAFCWGRDLSGSDVLYRFRRNGGLWAIAGPPAPGVGVASEPGAVLNPRSLHAYVVGSDSALYVHESTDEYASQWGWRALGTPNSTITVTWNVRPAVAAFQSRLFAFVRGSDGALWAHRRLSASDGGVWVPLGPPPGTTMSGHPTVVEHRHEGTPFLYVFVRGADRRLYVQRWDGAGSTLWAAFGRPTTGAGDRPAVANGGNTNVAGAPVAITARFEDTARIYAFLRGGDGHLHVCYWDGIDEWLWTDLDAITPPAPRLTFSPTSLSFGTVPVGGSAFRTLTITNISGIPTSVSIAASRVGAFDWPAGSPQILGPGQQREVRVEFLPHVAGNARAVMTVTTDSPGSTHTVSMAGRGFGETPV